MHYKTVIFVQVSENVKPHCTNVKPHYRGLSGDGSVATPSVSLAIHLVTVVRFNAIHEFTSIISFINPPLVAL